MLESELTMSDILVFVGAVLVIIGGFSGFMIQGTVVGSPVDITVNGVDERGVSEDIPTVQYTELDEEEREILEQVVVDGSVDASIKGVSITYSTFSSDSVDTDMNAFHQSIQSQWYFTQGVIGESDVQPVFAVRDGLDDERYVFEVTRVEYGTSHFDLMNRLKDYLFVGAGIGIVLVLIGGGIETWNKRKE